MHASIVNKVKTISLRKLPRDPLQVKRITRTGKPVQVADNGEPLWIVQPANGTEANEAERRRSINEILDEVLQEKPSKIKLSEVISQFRR